MADEPGTALASGQPPAATDTSPAAAPTAAPAASEAQPAAATAASPAAAPAAPAEPALNKDTIASLTKSRDMDGMRKLGERIRSGAAQPAAPQPAAVAPEGAPAAGVSPAPAASAATTPKKFGINYKGKPIEVDDTDNFLDRGSTGGVKKALLHKEQYIRDLEADLEETRRQAREVMTRTEQEKAALQKQIEESRKAGSPAPTAAASAAAPAAAPVARPIPPELPELSSDDPAFYSDEDRKALARFQVGTAKYNNEVAAYLDHIGTRPSSLPPDIQQKMANMERELAEARTASAQFAQASRQQENEAAETKRFAQYDTFWNAHSDVYGKPEGGTRDLHTKMMEWIDRLAQHNGVRQPLTPENTADPAWQQYNNAKLTLAGKYRNGDPDLIAASEGVEPPSGYKPYFEIAEINGKLQSYITAGKLGNRATLDDAYLLHMAETGGLDEAHNNMAKVEREKGLRAAGDAVQRSLQSPRTIPPGTSAPSSPPIVAADDVAWFRQVTPQMLAAKPEERARYERIAGVLRAANFTLKQQTAT